MKLKIILSIVTICLASFAILFSISLQPITIVLPHHNLVQDTRVDFLKNISSRRLFTSQIILIGPDHFSAYQNQITTSDIDWQLSTGVFKYKNLIDLPVNTLLHKNDHALFNPLSNLKTFFPFASVQTILVGQKVDMATLDKLLSQLDNVCRFDCLLVFSVDFSHYLPATLAHVHDLYTLSQLQNQDSIKAFKAEVDSPQSLYLMTKFASVRRAGRWQLFAHTNSGVISHNPDIETTTHIFGSYSSGSVPRDETTTKTISPQPFDRSYGVDEFVIDQSSKFVTSTINGNIKSFLPIKDGLFIRGEDKQRLIKNYFDSITDPSITKDYFWGTLIYD